MNCLSTIACDSERDPSKLYSEYIVQWNAYNNATNMNDTATNGSSLSIILIRSIVNKGYSGRASLSLDEKDMTLICLLSFPSSCPWSRLRPTWHYLHLLEP